MKRLLKNARVWILLIFLVLAIVSINPSSQEGVAIRGVTPESSAADAGVNSPAKNSRPLDYEVIRSINGVRVKTVSDYFDATANLEVNETVSMVTDQSSYFMTVQPLVHINQTGDTVTEEVTETIEEEINGTIVTRNVTSLITVNETISTVIGVKDLGLSVSDAATSNIRRGLDLEGGVRVLLQPEEQVDQETLDRVKDGLEQRLNAFGLNDVVIRVSGDLSGNDFILVEIAGMQKEEVESIIASQGKFEAKINESVVFRGGEDITYVCRSADCSGIDPYQGCQAFSDGTQCTFFFTIQLTPEAAQTHADITRELTLVPGQSGGSYLSQPLDLYLDGQLMNSLQIGASLRGRAETTIQISGAGVGVSREQAVLNALEEMHQLQAILETGSLPVKLDVVKIDSLSPVLGREFLRNALMTGLIALVAVGALIFIRYRTWKVAVPAVVASLCEVVLLLGVAALFGTNIDLAAIAGIIIVVGTSVDHQIVIADELLSKEEKNSKLKIKDAFFIIMAAFFTTFVAMVPLWFAGAGILKGFALTTIYGVSIGVFITRPAYAAVVEILLRK